MAKKDFIVKENIDREEEKKSSPGKQEEHVDQQGFTEVKNANASGLGSMGRNDEESGKTIKTDE